MKETWINGQVKTTYTDDDNGNTLTKTDPGQATQYTWDDQNLLVAADIITATGTKHLEYQYDANGIRVASKVDGQETCRKKAQKSDRTPAQPAVGQALAGLSLQNVAA